MSSSFKKDNKCHLIVFFLQFTEVEIRSLILDFTVLPCTLQFLQICPETFVLYILVPGHSITDFLEASHVNQHMLLEPHTPMLLFSHSKSTIEALAYHTFIILPINLVFTKKFSKEDYLPIKEQEVSKIEIYIEKKQASSS